MARMPKYDPRQSAVVSDLGSLIQIVKNQDEKRLEILTRTHKAMSDLKREISLNSKKSFQGEKDIHNLDNKIALLIKNRISVEEAVAASKDVGDLMQQRTLQLQDKKLKEQYGRLFYLLQRETVFIASVARCVKIGEIDNLLQTVMFTLYGNQYDDEEEHLLLSMFKNVLTEEFAEANSVSNFLRANSALTRMMTTYTRRGTGQQYLKSTLTDVLNLITSDPDWSLEINPSKVYEKYINDYEASTGKTCPLPRQVTAEEAAKVPEVIEIIEPRLQQLDDLCTKFIDSIIASLETVPYGIRWICKQIRLLAKEKFKDATREQVCSLIGGFFLLRFINPAVVTPQAFMLVEANLSTQSKRNLTLLAKILQNLANNVRFGDKEFFMAPLNSFLDTARPKLNQFLEDLTRVAHLDDHLQLDLYIRMGKTSEQAINISLNEMYFIHALLGTHKNVLIEKYPAQVKLLLPILDQLGKAPEQLKRADNYNVDLPLIDRDSDTNEGTSAFVRPEQLYTQAKFYFFGLLKDASKVPQSDNVSDMKNLLQLCLQIAKNKDAADRVKYLQQNLKQLIDLKQLTPEDDFLRLRKDTYQDCVNLELQISKSTNDLKRLKGVLDSIKEHNNYLNQQHEAYKQYLQNVRENATTALPNKKDKKDKKDKKKRGPFKYSHSKLVQEGIITKSEVPEDRRGSIFFSFSELNSGQFQVDVLFKIKKISEMRLQLDDLLDRQVNNDISLETEFLTLNVNKLIYLLNKCFLTNQKKK